MVHLSINSDCVKTDYDPLSVRTGTESIERVSEVRVVWPLVWICPPPLVAFRDGMDLRKPHPPSIKHVLLT